jgi:hypothetical protein
VRGQQAGVGKGRTRQASGAGGHQTGGLVSVCDVAVPGHDVSVVAVAVAQSDAEIQRMQGWRLSATLAHDLLSEVDGLANLPTERAAYGYRTTHPRPEGWGQVCPRCRLCAT